MNDYPTYPTILIEELIAKLMSISVEHPGSKVLVWDMQLDEPRNVHQPEYHDWTDRETNGEGIYL